MLQFITNTESKVSVTDQIKQVVAGGCKWIQIRMKDASDDEIKRVFDDVKQLCYEQDVLIVIDDRVALAKEIQASGVHLGKEDMLPSKARIELGPAAIIGVTANTFEDVIAVRSLDVDYIGAGPFRHTTTKKKLAPVLGSEGLRNICDRMAEAGIEIPVVAVGGITIGDVEELFDTGVKGIAVSGAIANAADIAAETARFIEKINKYIRK